MVAHGYGADAPTSRTDLALRLLVVASLVIVSGLAWVWTTAMADVPACHLLPLGSFLVMWTVMMAAMMFPSVIPSVLAFLVFSRGRRTRPLLAAAVFVAGYLAVWGLLGLPARALLAGGARATAALGLSPRAAALASGTLLVACGLYQLTPLKDACLRHCRMPHLFLGHHWRDGHGGAFLLGMHHGLYCAGCCASLMLVLMIVGLMDLAWMAGLSLVIYVEKVLPAGRLAGWIAGVALMAVGVARLAA